MTRRPVGFAMLALGAIGFAAVAGLGSAHWAIRAGPQFGAMRAGPWSAEPGASTADADPYALARRVRQGVIAPLAFESLSFVATTDSAGALLDGRCDYRVQGAVPPARTWTLTAARPNGTLFRTPAQRHGFTAAEIVRLGSTDPVVVVSARARPGNWLPVADGPLQLILRLYDTAIGSASGASPLSLPRIVREGCR